MKTMRFVLPLPDNFSNSRAHWRTKNRAKKQYWEDCDLLVAAQKAPRAPAKPWGKARITAAFFCWNEMDQSNLMARMKWPEDFLVTRGYLEDDSPRHLQYTGIPTQEIDRKNQRLEIVLEKV